MRSFGSDHTAGPRRGLGMAEAKAMPPPLKRKKKSSDEPAKKRWCVICAREHTLEQDKDWWRKLRRAQGTFGVFVVGSVENGKKLRCTIHLPTTEEHKADVATDCCGWSCPVWQVRRDREDL
jgi:hypothetical protein